MNGSTENGRASISSKIVEECKPLHVTMGRALLKEIVDAASTLRDEVVFRFSDEGLLMELVDPAHVEMMVLKVRKEAFTGTIIRPRPYEIFPETYSPWAGKELTEDVLGVDLDHVKDFLRIGSDTEKDPLPECIEMRRVMFEGRPRVELSMELPSYPPYLQQEVPVLRSSFNLIQSDAVPKVPNLDMPTWFNFCPRMLVRALNALEPVSDHYAIEVTEDRTVMISASGDCRDVSYSFAKVDKDVHERTLKRYRTLVPADYFLNLIRGVIGCPMMVMRLDTDRPVVIEGHTQKGLCVKAMLAPRIMND